MQDNARIRIGIDLTPLGGIRARELARHLIVAAVGERKSIEAHLDNARPLACRRLRKGDDTENPAAGRDERITVDVYGVEDIGLERLSDARVLGLECLPRRHENDSPCRQHASTLRCRRLCRRQCEQQSGRAADNGSRSIVLH
jgi:hypothetical protein